MNINKYQLSSESLEHLLALLSADTVNQPKEVQELFYCAALRRFSFFWFLFLSEIILDKNIALPEDGNEHPFDTIGDVLITEGLLFQEEAPAYELLSELYDEIAFYEPAMLLEYDEIFKELCNQASFMKLLVERFR